MTATLYDISVDSYLRILGGVAGFLEKGRAHCAENNIDLNEMVEARIFVDMQPLRFQVEQVASHTAGSVRALKTGAYGPPSNAQPLDYAGLQKLIADARQELEAVNAADINAQAGRDVRFEVGERVLPFTAEMLILSFALPNCHFHATTAYDILRMKGVPLGKRDYLGAIRTKS